jgi:catechol 2,3-dioxygenase-like lactoylglutathione lyase family enzyme
MAHVAFTVSDMEASAFEGAEFISLEDRDGIQIELWAPRPTRA